MMWVILDPRVTMDHFGFIPSFLSWNNPKPAREQFNENYISGWFPLDGSEVNPRTGFLKYPGDSILKPLAVTILRKERIFLYEYGLVAILQPDGSSEVSRLD